MAVLDGGRAEFSDGRVGSWLEQVGSPVDPDRSDDVVVVTTLRRIGRVATLGVQVGQRYVQERRMGDPAAWMFAARSAFGGRTPIEACQDLVHFGRGIALHAVGQIDGASDEEGLEDHEDETPRGREADDREEPRDGPGLFSAFVWDALGERKLLLFHAAVAASRGEYEMLLEQRLGPRLAGVAVVSDGFDPGSQVATALLAPALANGLALAGADPGSSFASGVEVQVEQRFSN